jgi:hypothetical protein
VRAALRAEVPCIDCSGVFAQRSEVPLAWAGAGERIPTAPLLAAPADAALVWLPILRALAPLGAPAHVRGVILRGCVRARPRGHRRALARFARAVQLAGPREDEDVQGPPLAFDCRPSSGALADGRRARESALAAVLARALSPAPAISARWIQVARVRRSRLGARDLVGRAVDAGEAAQLLAKAPGVELWKRRGRGSEPARGRGPRRVVASHPEPDAASRSRCALGRGRPLAARGRERRVARSSVGRGTH